MALDVTKRLKNILLHLEDSATIDHVDRATIKDAADEIERLRFALGAIASLHQWPDNLMSDVDIARSALGVDDEYPTCADAGI